MPFFIGPLETRRKELEVKKEVFQFMRDVEDENIWIEEKMNLVSIRFRPFWEKINWLFHNIS